MRALGFQEKALRASPAEEVYQFKKGDQELMFTLRKITVVFSEFTELRSRSYNGNKRRFDGMGYLNFSDEVSFSQS